MECTLAPLDKYSCSVVCSGDATLCQITLTTCLFGNVQVTTATTDASFNSMAKDFFKSFKKDIRSIFDKLPDTLLVEIDHLIKPGSVLHDLGIRFDKDKGEFFGLPAEWDKVLQSSKITYVYCVIFAYLFFS